MSIRFNPRQSIAKIRRRYAQTRTEKRIRRLIEMSDFSGFHRIYLYHIRKTAGTSLVKMFMSLSDRDGADVFAELGRQSDRPLICDPFVFVGWDRSLIELGNYTFGFSHYSLEQVEVPAETFRMTCFRDPVERLMSHYRMLLDFSRQDEPHPCFATEGKWLGDSLADFLERIPRQHLLNQLFMFSDSYSINEAVARVRSLDHVMFVDRLDDGIAALNGKTGLALRIRHDRRSEHRFDVSAAAAKRIREMLDDEYRFLQLVRNRARCEPV